MHKGQSFQASARWLRKKTTRLDGGLAFLPESAWSNWILKHQYAQLVELSRSRELAAAVGQTLLGIQKWFAIDQEFWHGWYSRNNGTIGFLGDHTAGESGMGATILELIMIGLAIALAGFLRQFSTAAASKKFLPDALRTRKPRNRNRSAR